MKTLENELEVTDARLLKMASYKNCLTATLRMNDAEPSWLERFPAYNE